MSCRRAASVVAALTPILRLVDMIVKDRRVKCWLIESRYEVGVTIRAMRVGARRSTFPKLSHWH